MPLQQLIAQYQALAQQLSQAGVNLQSLNISPGQITTPGVSVGPQGITAPGVSVAPGQITAPGVSISNGQITAPGVSVAPGQGNVSMPQTPVQNVQFPQMPKIPKDFFKPKFPTAALRATFSPTQMADAVNDNWYQPPMPEAPSPTSYF